MRTIQWFPGHMTRAMRMMGESAALCDGAVMVLDARCPASSFNVKLKKVFAGKPVLYVLNKSDLVDADALREALLAHPDAQAISAREGTGIRGLLYRIAQEAASGSVTMSVLVPYEKGLLMKMVHERCQVMRETYVQEGLLATVKADPRMASTLEPYRVEDEASDPNPDLGPGS